MHLTLLFLLPVCLSAQPSAKSEVYLAKEADSLLVVVTLRVRLDDSFIGWPAPAGVLINSDPRLRQDNRPKTHG